LSDTPEIRINVQPEAETPDEEYELELIRQYMACFSGPAGEFVLRDLMNLVNIGHSTFVAVEFDPLKAAHLDGGQAIVWRCLNYSGRRSNL
jgi:hypothetical protein